MTGPGVLGRPGVPPAPFMKPNRVLIGTCLVAALGGTLFGFDTAVISGVQDALRDLFHLDGFQQGMVTAVALVGTVLGALIAAKPGDLYGRRDSLKVAGVFYLACALGCALAWNLASLVFFRFLGGVAVGASSVLGPLYLAEISPARWRGRLVGFFQFNVVFGILLAFLSNYLVGLGDFGAHEWRWKLGVQVVPAFLFFVLLWLIPRSPRWLVMRGHDAEALHVLRLIGEEDPERTVGRIRRSVHRQQGFQTEPLFRAPHWKPVFLAVLVAFFNQAGGINAIFYYLNPIFAMAGFSKVSGDLQSVAVGGTNLIFTVVGMALIDRVGRRPLLLWGTLGCGLCLAGIAAVFSGPARHDLLVWLLVGYIACHAFGQGAVVWVYISEVFPNAVRAKGQTLGGTTHWVMAALISWGFPVFARPAGTPGAGLPFAVFALMMIVQIVVVWRFFPETKGTSLEEVEEVTAA
ncbi:MAG: sugar porter family MFS transporter [Verrucomicrobium sp.]|nr:sugar porter family MFS transporter [Verrucomicrobium sp.]